MTRRSDAAAEQAFYDTHGTRAAWLAYLAVCRVAGLWPRPRPPRRGRETLSRSAARRAG
ncbi:hypothetical protein [Jannaschia ovalis]|uniref:Uncharacterized protein n=1 Tax=Jannaschia ovalis TaxID=3038773 RepID=A0ABY8LBR2_9RHOB|nr:hypothetical protein [Jannaschia sp. GRR-S6-38]WGH77594.1 hypothetical protein P8627_11155 [Jannaschia sp. GRR-S6-38]